jgi:UDP:flavonoid glycosyltransferase YjiC (YdhE family)
MPAERLKVLMFAEAVTLAHVARPLCLASALDPSCYDVTIACDPRYARFVQSGEAPGLRRYVPLHSISPERFIHALAMGRPVYDQATFATYVEQDRALIAAFRPDVVVGDFRLSLSVSARLEKRPYLAISNAYWSPDCADGFPLPVLPMTRLLPLAVAKPLFDFFRPLAFAGHCRPMNQLRLKHGMGSLGNDLRRVYTDADHLLLADSPVLFPVASFKQRSSFLGPLLWSPQIALPSWWRELRDDQPVVYVSFGSSGSPVVLTRVLQALAGLPLQVVASTAGRPLPKQVPTNARIADYLPGDLATARASLVICNGGSLSVQQALMEAVPVLAVASNMDQFMNMLPVQDAGAGLMLRADRINTNQVRQACEILLDPSVGKAAAQRLRSRVALQNKPAAQVFEAAVAGLLKLPARH